MLKIGQLVLAGGDWFGRRLMSREWVTQSTTPIVAIGQSRSYGYHWYMGAAVPSGGSQRHPWVGGFLSGWGGQRLFVLPELDLAVAINCGNYGKSLQEQNNVTGAILVAVVLPLVS